MQAGGWRELLARCFELAPSCPGPAEPPAGPIGGVLSALVSRVVSLTVQLLLFLAPLLSVVHDMID